MHPKKIVQITKKSGSKIEVHILDQLSHCGGECRHFHELIEPNKSPIKLNFSNYRFTQGFLPGRIFTGKDFYQSNQKSPNF